MAAIAASSALVEHYIDNYSQLIKCLSYINTIVFPAHSIVDYSQIMFTMEPNNEKQN